MAALEVSKNPIVIVDGGAGRSSWASHAIDLVKSLKTLHFNTVMGKGIVGEEYLQPGRFGHVICEIARINDESWPLILLEQFDYANGAQYAQRITLVARIRRCCRRHA